VNIARSAVFSSGQSARASSPARPYLLLSGVFLLIISVLGLVYDQSFALGSDADESAHVFGILETNGWHSLAGLFGGLAALALAAKAEWSRFGALSLGVTYIVVTIVLGIWDPRTFSIASNTADNLVHGLLGVGGIASALATRSAPS